MPRPLGIRGAAVRAGAVLVAGVVIAGLYTTQRIASQGERDERRPADAIVVLGAAQFDGVPTDVFKARLDHAVELYEAGFAPWFIATGGRQPGDRTTEAATARAYAIAHGVPAKAILTEDRSRNTLESIQAVELIFRAHGFASGLFVSDRTHMLRVLRMATDQGIKAWGSPTTTSPTDTDPVRHQRAVIHEVEGLLAYYFGGGQLIDENAINGAQ